ncbi:ABC transporter ATP-binding protein [Bermanella sp. WJH001]|uniref:ABC transporter ATP-binding protein n=1 Tax=Bermanella sp. WJH001 TaxID=3048005 RepID=UPI0024BEC04B|nr:ABC transporter ATP-binding protein [Bermanella sp. WJH001]MDJ1537095.1 ABC transporter ATP-binding protein [Bermanella sp. WJH001]
MSKKEHLLSVKDLCVDFETDQGTLNVLDHVSFDIEKGKTLGLVGESGCGKSVTSLAIMKLLPQPAGKIRSGAVSFKDIPLSSLAAEELRQIRGNRIAMIFQEPMTALNPVKSIGKQIIEVFELHRPELTKKQMLQETISVLDKVGIPDAQKRISEYPHQLSGGMRQRVMIAMALACKPDLLIADEPTTALDVTIQAQILDLMQSLQKEYGMGILFITHDLGVIAQLCDDVVVMYAGRVAEKCSVEALFKQPKHPYTKGLLNSIPKLNQPNKSRLNTIEGQVPTLQNMPQGCRFYNRCPFKQDNCKTLDHSFINQKGSHYVNCLHWDKF